MDYRRSEAPHAFIPAESTPLFIVGADRSGTTLVKAMVNQHPEVAIPFESWFLIPLLDSDAFPRQVRSHTELRHVLDVISSHERWREWRLASQGGLHNLLSSQIELPAALRYIVELVFRLETCHSGRYWGDKTPEYVFYAAELAALFPDAKIMEVVRDGRDVFLSLRQKKWRGIGPWQIGRYWASAIDAGRRAGQVVPQDRYLKLEYESLVLDMPAAVSRITSFLELSGHEADMMSFYDNATGEVSEREARRGVHEKLHRPPEEADVGRWKRSNSRVAIALFEAVAHDALIEAGYRPTRSTRSASALRAIAWARGAVWDKRCRRWLSPVARAIRRRLPARSVLSLRALDWM